MGSLTSQLLFGLGMNLAAMYIYERCPSLARWLVNASAKFAGGDVERHREEWLADLGDQDGNLAQLWHALGCARVAIRMSFDELLLVFIAKWIAADMNARTQSMVSITAKVNRCKNLLSKGKIKEMEQDLIECLHEHKAYLVDSAKVSSEYRKFIAWSNHEAAEEAKEFLEEYEATAKRRVVELSSLHEQVAIGFSDLKKKLRSASHR